MPLAKNNKQLRHIPTLFRPNTPSGSNMIIHEDVADLLRIINNLYHYVSIVELSDDAIFSKDLKGIITSWNMGAERVYGYTAQEMVGKSVATIIPADREDEFPEIMQRIQEGYVIDHYETKRQRKDGVIIDVSVTISPIKDLNSTIVGASIIARDITERKEIEVRKDEFISIASHEFKTPMTSIKAFTQILKMRAQMLSDPEFAGLLERMEKQIDRLANLMKELLDVSRIQTGKLESKFEQVSISELVYQTVADMQPLTATHTITVRGSTNAIVTADRDRIHQVLINLLDNAIKYSPSARKVIVRMKATKRVVTISIQDFGIGIPKKEHSKIFERFYRPHEYKDAFQGQGLGLFIVAEIVRQHGGEIWVTSEPGSGSTFSFTLPVVSQ